MNIPGDWQDRAYWDQISENKRLGAEIERLRAAIADVIKSATNTDNGALVPPDAFGRLYGVYIGDSETDDGHEQTPREKPKPHSKDCLAHGIPGASCLAPKCDC